MVLSPPVQRTWNVNDVVTAAMMNANVRDAVNYVLGWFNRSMTVSSATPQSLTTNTWTAGSSMTLEVDYGGGTMTAVATGVTVSEAGQYLVSAGGTMAANSTGNRYIGLSANGSSPIRYSQGQPTVASPDTTQIMTTQMIPAAAGQTISVYFYQSSGGALNLNSHYLSVRRIG